MLSQDLKLTIRTKEHHVAFFNFLYGFYSPTEDRIKTQLTPDIFPDMEHCTAKETFITFKNWIEKHELQPELRR